MTECLTNMYTETKYMHRIATPAVSRKVRNLIILLQHMKLHLPLNQVGIQGQLLHPAISCHRHWYYHTHRKSNVEGVERHRKIGQWSTSLAENMIKVLSFVMPSSLPTRLCISKQGYLIERQAHWLEPSILLPMSSSGTGSSDAIMQDTVILICPCCQLEVQCRNAPRARERPLLTHIMDVHCQNGDLICPVPKCGQPQKDLHLLREHLRNEVRKRNRHIHTPCPVSA
jgi:hypothetical protein